MKKTFIFTALTSIFIPLSFANSTPVTVSVSAKNELVLRASTCDILLKQRQALCSWKESIDQNFKAQSSTVIKCESEGKNKFKLSVLDCLPEFTKNFQNKKLAQDGPNCWGTAMSFKKLSINPRFMWPEEMLYWMNSPLCRKLSPSESKMPGDIINVYAPEKLDESDMHSKDAGIIFWETLYPERYVSPVEVGYSGFHRLLHSVTYISPELAFGKDSPAFDDRFYFHPMEEVYGRPRSDEPDCLENQTRNPHMREYGNTPQNIRGSKCSYFSLAYRCEDFAAFFEKDAKSSEALEILKRVQSLQEMQKKISPQLMSTKKLFSPKEAQELVDRADLSVKRSMNEMKQKGLDKVRERLLVMEYFSAAGIRQTLEQSNLITPSK